MACNILRNQDGTNTIIDSKGNPSILYDNLLQLLSEYPYTTSELIPTDDINNLALQYYELSNSPEFRSKYNLTSKLDVEVSIDDIINHIRTEYSFNENQEIKQGIYPYDRIVFGHPTIGKSFLKNQGEDKFISLDDDYATEINSKVKEIADKYNVTTYQVKDGGTQEWNNEYNQMMQEMFDIAKQQAISENKTLFTSNTNLLRNNIDSFDKVINLTNKEFERRIKERGAKYDIKEWKSQINEVISKVPANKVITTDKYLSDLFIEDNQSIEEETNINYQLASDVINPAIEELDNYLHMLEEAAKRDHRKLGAELELFHIQDEAKGMIFWHNKGYSIFRTIERYIRNKVTKADYIEVRTPVVADIKLWEKSGHIEKFKDDMLFTSIGENEFALKPMNCPCHVQIFNQGIKSYKQLPIRMAEFGNCHRNEASGALHGLMRLRGFTQDDAHIFCTEDQITEESIKFCNLLQEVYKDFGFEEIIVKFSTRPAKRAGSDETWDKAEKGLKDAIEDTGLSYSLNPGEGAFYGPKLEFTLKDAIGRLWQCGTLQLDFVLPVRLEASYIDSNGQKQIPVMLHRAILGSMERFIGILIEQHAGKFPIWLAPVQVVVAAVTNEIDSYATEIYEKLKANGIRCEIDLSSEKISYKIRNHSLQKIPLIIILGKNEVDNKNISLRRLGSQETQSLRLDELIKEIKDIEAKYIN
jgi:threonyl-tRNA synthetase